MQGWLIAGHDKQFRAAQLFFNELTSERARELFGDFADLWNRRRLPARYYQGIAGTTMRRTQHSWAVRGVPHLANTSRRKTQRLNNDGGDDDNVVDGFRCGFDFCDRFAGGGAGTAGVVTGIDAAMEEEREAARRGAALERRRWRKDEKEQLDELLPKATGRRACLAPRVGAHVKGCELSAVAIGIPGAMWPSVTSAHL